MRIKKIAPTPPANGNIENEYGTSQTNAYSEAYANTTFATKTELASIIESGSNTYGRYIKYSDGTLIQYGRISKTNFLATTTTSSSAQGITFYRSPLATVTLPVSFSSTGYTLVANVGTETNGTRFYIPRPGSRNVGSFQIQVIGVEDFLENEKGYTNLGSVDWQVIGRWN